MVAAKAAVRTCEDAAWMYFSTTSAPFQNGACLTSQPENFALPARLWICWTRPEASTYEIWAMTMWTLSAQGVAKPLR